MNPAVHVSHVSKTFTRTSGRALIGQRVREMLGLAIPGSLTFHALRDVSFDVNDGESVGLIGPNGAGKSTLLSMVAGLAYPDEGNIRVRGRIAPLLELGSGFHPDLTGEENVKLNASLLGLTRQQVAGRMDKIAEYAEIPGFLKEPLRTYSTGMVTRLAFAVAVNVDPDVLILDEVLAVGDQGFQLKCLEKVQEYRDAGKTMLSVSHSMGLVEQFCDRVIWLDHGRIQMDGPVKEVSAAYMASVRRQAHAGAQQSPAS